MSSRIIGSLAVLLGAFTFDGCGTAGHRASPVAHRYDLGAPAMAVYPGPMSPNGAASRAGAASPAFGPFKLVDMGAPAGLDSDGIVYRLAYAHAQQLRTYTSNRWTATPAQLLTQRLRALLGARGAVVSPGDPVSAPVLRVELLDFEQIFDKPGASRGVVALRATLLRRGGQFMQATFRADVPAPSADAIGGVRALAQASDVALSQLVDWLASQPALAR
ncbi:PqiC family protein [Mycetohabitans sp. B5]|uniref:Cholesterol transport system auxiliary component n=1 Tax=Mycetohabitans endofungorum TaxID=417203 RepID=A0A2P5KDQ3_9BURK|nr:MULTISPECIES: ABC-type transport auxiliary lipoprotein family protein [Mycetohabitans]MCG1055816.1 PqiC family protein [Mycetohabitans sp. B5]PPB84834.1 cholesterol transport system auxiliary component [Mycetohabitans endofungorum]